MSLHESGALERFAGLTHENAMNAMQLRTPDGRIYSGAEAAARALATRPMLGKLAFIYYVPVIRQLMDFLYRRIAKVRYRIAGRVGENCPEGTCRLHGDAGDTNSAAGK